jgi:uncharacterized protein
LTIGLVTLRASMKRETTDRPGFFERLAARAILRPFRSRLFLRTALDHREVAFQGEGGTRLVGWQFPRKGRKRRGALVFLHGHSDNRHLAVRAAECFSALGYDVLAYDQRAHGRSEGDHCTYGFLEKRDLVRALDAFGIERAVVLGTSLGAAVALQAAPFEKRIEAIVAHAPFVDLRAAIDDRSRIFSRRLIEAGIAAAEQEAGFRADEVSPLIAARSVKAPVLLVHGSRDPWTPPWHSQRILEALAGPKELLLVQGATHSNVMRRPEVWTQMAQWVQRAVR